jgi:hypothetical protein
MGHILDIAPSPISQAAHHEAYLRIPKVLPFRSRTTPYLGLLEVTSSREEAHKGSSTRSTMGWYVARKANGQGYDRGSHRIRNVVAIDVPPILEWLGTEDLYANNVY